MGTIVPISLSSRIAPSAGLHSDAAAVLRVTRDAALPGALRANYALVVDSAASEIPDGFPAAISFGPSSVESVISVGPELNYLGDGDIIRIERARGRVKVLFRKSSRYNFFMLTERCDHYCLMCSQPPKRAPDDWLLDEAMKCITLLDRGTPFVGITGGEPTLLEERFIDLVRRLNGLLPETSVLVLTNGKKFRDERFANEIAEIGHRDLTLAIPLYSDVPAIHDYVVQSDGAFGDTVRGILRLKERGQKVQVRVVIHRATYARLPQLAEFLFRNLAFVDHVALMGLEITGFARANFEELWIDPMDYRAEIESAALFLGRMGMNVSIFNHQLCTLPASVRHMAVQSISDWKRGYVDACASCTVREQCGGLFTTSHGGTSRGIQAI